MVSESVLIFAAVFIASMLLTGIIRRVALARGVMDVPNARSSHVLPTPRGGGKLILNRGSHDNLSGAHALSDEGSRWR